MFSMIRYELKHIRVHGGYLSALLYFGIVFYSFYAYVYSHAALKNLPQMIAYMYNGRTFVALSIVIGIHIASYMHADQHDYARLTLTALSPDRSSTLMVRFVAFVLRLLFGEIIAVAVAVGCVYYFNLPITMDEVGYGAMAFIEIFLIYMFIAALFTLVSVVFKDELFTDLLSTAFSFLPVGLFFLLNRFRIDLTGFSVTATIYELGNDVNVNQGLIASALAFLYCCACMLISMIILRKRNL